MLEYVAQYFVEQLILSYIPGGKEYTTHSFPPGIYLIFISGKLFEALYIAPVPPVSKGYQVASTPYYLLNLINHLKYNLRSANVSKWFPGVCSTQPYNQI